MIAAMRTAIFAFAASAFLLPEHAGAVERPDTLRYVMEEIVVFGRRSVTPPATVSEIDAGGIARRLGSTVADMLAVDPGLRITTGAKAETATGIRGFPARDILVLLDGRPLNPGYYGTVDLSMLPVDNVARIKVIKGPSSVAYGANSMGGVINIVTKNGWEEPRTTFMAEGGTGGYRRETLDHGGRSGRLNWWMTAYESVADGYPLSDDFEATSLEDGGTRDNASWRKAGVSGKIGFEATPAAEYALTLGLHAAEKDVPATVYSWDDPRYREFPEWFRYHAAVNGRWFRDDRVEASTVIFADAYRDRLIEYAGPERDPADVAYDSDLENWTVGGSADASLATGPHRLRAGVGARRDLFNKRSDVDEPWESHHVLSGNLFAEEVWLPRPGTEAIAGLGWAFFGIENQRDGRGRLCPMASVRQEMPGRIVVRGSWARAVRFPTLHHLYSASSGNPELEPEEADKMEIGIERVFGRDGSPRLSVACAFFRNDLTNLIYRGARTYRYENIGEAMSQGIETRIAWNWSERFRGSIGYAWIDPDRSTAELMEETPPHKVDVNLGVSPVAGMTIDYWIDRLDERSTRIDGFVLTACTVHGISVSQAVGDQLSIRLQVSNIADTRYEDELGYPSPGRRVVVGLAWSPWAAAGERSGIR